MSTPAASGGTPEVRGPPHSVADECPNTTGSPWLVSATRHANDAHIDASGGNRGGQAEPEAWLRTCKPRRRSSGIKAISQEEEHQHHSQQGAALPPFRPATHCAIGSHRPSEPFPLHLRMSSAASFRSCNQCHDLCPTSAADGCCHHTGIGLLLPARGV